MNFFVEADYAVEKLNSPDVLFVDARGADAYKSGTLPNAIVIDWRDLTDEQIELGEEGWGHIPPLEFLSQKLGQFGLDKNKELIIFSGAQEAWGEDGRILWQLRAVGYKHLCLVNGGIQSIAKHRVTLTNTTSPPKPVSVELSELDETYIIDTAQLTKDRFQYKLVDTREKDEYDGAVKFGEAVGGHIPSAINIPFGEMFGEDFRIKSAPILQNYFESKGLFKEDSIVVYCTGGIRSAFMQLVFEACGYENVKSYQGSYYNWCKINDVEK